MKLALAQMEIVWEDKDKNLATAENYMDMAKKDNCDMLLFPEMSFTGFTMNTGYSAERDGETVKKVSALAKKYGLAVGFGWVKQGNNGKAENHYTVVDENGKILSDYAKIHPFSYGGEDAYFEGGNQVVCFTYKDICFSNFICYDLRFPEIFQAVSDRAEVILLPANWPEKRRMHWKTLLQARAIENQVYMVGINCCGNMGGLSYSGDSRVIHPSGEVIAKAQKPGLVYCELEKDVAVLREAFPVKKDRKEELYRGLLKRNPK